MTRHTVYYCKVVYITAHMELQEISIW